MNKCTHQSAKRVFRVGKTHIWAGAQVELLERTGWSFILSAVGFSKFAVSPITTNEAAKALMPDELTAWPVPPSLGIDWPDMGTPTLSREWWALLAKALLKINGDIGLCCVGGHGRTGTILAILAAHTGKVKKKDCPVDWVRKRYCKKAVESTAQLDYIERVTGFVVSSDPSAASELSLKWPTAAGGYTYPVANVNPTSEPLPKAKEVAIGTGSDGGRSVEQAAAAVHDSSLTDDQLINHWFECEEDAIRVKGEDGIVSRLVPVWDNEGELAGWREES